MMIDLDFCPKCGKPLLYSDRFNSTGHWFTKKTKNGDEVTSWFHKDCNSEVFEK